MVLFWWLWLLFDGSPRDRDPWALVVVVVVDVDVDADSVVLVSGVACAALVVLLVGSLVLALCVAIPVRS